MCSKINAPRLKILAIETSCDETAASIAVDSGCGVKILSNIVSSQIDIHKKYGGVVPEVAAREHVLDILPVIDEALELAGIKKSGKVNGGVREGAPGCLDALAVTVGPGLMSSLQTGVETAKSLAYVWDLPIVGVNHIEGHIYANFINLKKKIDFPALVLTVSGGHTQLVLMREHGDFETIGDTRDDAAGEAFDKAAKLMGLGYPGGPVVSVRAEKFARHNIQHISEIKLPRPMIRSDDFDFSFSGLKTAIRYKIEKDDNWKNKIDEYCYEFQEAVVDVLVFKTIKAAKKYNIKTVMLAGGVAANKRLREVLQKNVEEKLSNVRFMMPELKYTTDNAAMIASAGIFRAKKKDFINRKDLRANCNFEFVK